MEQAHNFGKLRERAGGNAGTEASQPASLRSRVLVAAASSVAVTIVTMAISAAVAVSTATRLLAGKIATLLRRRPPLNLAHLLRPILLTVLLPILRTVLALRALEGALLVAPVRGLPVHPLDGGAVLPPLPIGLGGALLAE